MSDQGQERQMPVCPMMGVQTVPVKSNVTSIATKQGVQLQDRFHPCLGGSCAWFVRVTLETGNCALMMLAASMAGWEHVETEDAPEAE